VDNATAPQPGIYLFPADSSKISNRGVLGRSSPSTAAIGRALCEEICSQLVALIQQHMGAAPTPKKRSSKKR
jgi:creatinine amidohydrolase/Fe(II)-dependent formamide hydrolase-like protein